jgi:hypothetical protein
MCSRVGVCGISSRQGSGAVLLDNQVEEHFVFVTGVGSPASQPESEMQAREQYRQHLVSQQGFTIEGKAR